MAELVTVMYTRALDLLRAVDTASAGLCLGDRPCRRQCFSAEASVAPAVGLCLGKGHLRPAQVDGREYLDRAQKAWEGIQHGNRKIAKDHAPLESAMV